MNIDKKSAYLGCLLGGAVGDALGYPVEFMNEASIFNQFGRDGIRTLAQAGAPAKISDDTQMTLFAANGIICKILGAGLAPNCPYREWLATQGDASHMDDPQEPKMWIYTDLRLHHCRAPGSTCLTAIREHPDGGNMHEPINDSKGCGTVMRAAPFGLSVMDNGYGDDSRVVTRWAARDAALTHGHKTAWAASESLANIIFHIVQYRKPYHVLQNMIDYGKYCGYGELTPQLELAVKLALDRSVPDLDGIHTLGEGWVAEEALAIAVFCAVRYQHDFAAAIRAAVNHTGDSDSTGAVCGNILGAWLGVDAVRSAFDLDNLELCDLIERIAEDLYAVVNERDFMAASDACWRFKKYSPYAESHPTEKGKETV
ncbi:MAG: ADP-ribosylglycohydrolase family protein [Clostridia bacterium]|nr:ADP-ribosylglycohydrolase family protein [Clostridia bacterium]